MKNTFRESIEMYDTDFQAQWGEDEDPEATPSPSPRTRGPLPNWNRWEEINCRALSLAVDEERSGQLVYEVPQGYVDFSLSYLELYDDGSEEGNTGDTYFVFFTAQDAL